jgi:predicted RNA-binding protein associated with RNAse of E/G family
VVDLDEMADALRDGKMSSEEVQTALRHLDELLSVIYSGHFDRLQKYINDVEA